MNKVKLQEFLIKARTNTYAKGKGKVKPALLGSEQLEYKEKSWLYRDVYFIGNGIFAGLETIYFQKKPVWSMSYFGNFKSLSEQEIDKILRKALIENANKTRLWNLVEWEFENYKYICEPDSKAHIDELGGSEKILKNDQQVYFFYYAGGFIG